ncbi:hypothetical protein [Pseudomonas anguilliseptica]|uniref:hypothetical protein n=1 Tax=Pseudomonas anguilliseptica TaxID=53406 RepID=UPI003736C610
MRLTNFSAVLFFLYPAISLAGFEYITITANSKTSISKQCPGNTETLSLHKGKITITPKIGPDYKLPLDEFPEKAELILGRSSISSNCTLAVEYAKNDVNESYSLLIYSKESKKFIPSQISTITNPDFPEGRILSSYRDSALLHNDTLCFSERLNDYFLCERREQFHSNLEKIETCDEQLCSAPDIVKSGSQNRVSGIITSKKTFFYNKAGEEELLKRKGYLIKGDKIHLHDYLQTRDNLYYNVSFSGKKTVAGWINSNDISIED